VLDVADDFLASQTGSGPSGFAAAPMMIHEIQTSLNEDHNNALQSMRRVFDEAQRANVMIYAYDVVYDSRWLKPSGPGKLRSRSHGQG
jgi:hypothetical protein